MIEEENSRQGDDEFEKVRKAQVDARADEQRSKRWFKSKRQREQEEGDCQIAKKLKMHPKHSMTRHRQERFKICCRGNEMKKQDIGKA